MPPAHSRAVQRRQWADSRPARHARPPSGVTRALRWTLVGVLVPGAALLAAGRRTGAVAVGVSAVSVGGALWLATTGQRTALQWALDPTVLLVVAVGVVLLAAVWMFLLTAGYVSLVPPRASRPQRRAGAAVVAVLCATAAVPTGVAAQAVLQQRSLVLRVFTADGASPTVVDRPEGEGLFGGASRINVLLLGADAGEGRDGVRTDTVIVASVDVATGDTVLVSVPRNLEDLPFPPGSPLDEAYPEGFDAGSESESLLNAVYRNGPAEHPDILGPSTDPGADFLKLGVGEALGLTIDYHVLVDLDGFSRLVDALGGVELDVNYYVPVGGEPTTGRLPDDYIAPGPNQWMDGGTALAFARGRFGLSDYQRMDRQRCVMDAIVEAADPLTLATRYGDVATATEDIVSTDLPRSLLDDAVDLGLRVQGAEVRSLVLDNTVIEPGDPDYPEIRALVREALSAPPAAAAPTEPQGPPGAPSPPGGPGATDATPGNQATDDPAAGGSVGDTVGDGGESAAPGEIASPEPLPLDDVADTCVYDPEQAQEALDAGEPPTFRSRRDG